MEKVRWAIEMTLQHYDCKDYTSDFDEDTIIGASLTLLSIEKKLHEKWFQSERKHAQSVIEQRNKEVQFEVQKILKERDERT